MILDTIAETYLSSLWEVSSLNFLHHFRVRSGDFEGLWGNRLYHSQVRHSCLVPGNPSKRHQNYQLQNQKSDQKAETQIYQNFECNHLKLFLETFSYILCILLCHFISSLEIFFLIST